MHQQAFRFCQAALADLDTSQMDVLEAGSYIVNGSVRPLFPTTASYTGLDVRKGDGVDVVADAATYQHPSPVDLVISTEMLEHAPEQAAVVANLARQLKPGGRLILTAAGVERQPHNNDGHHGLPADEFYANVAEDDLAAWLAAAGFATWTITRDERAGDIYVTALMPEALPEMTVAEIEATTPAPPRRRRRKEAADASLQ